MTAKSLEKNRTEQNINHRPSRLLEVVDPEVINKFLKSFQDATGLRASIVDNNGQPVLGLDKQHNCKFCQLIWEYPKGFERCVGAYCRAGKQAARFSEPYIFRCPAGLIEWATPIIIDEEHMGSVICGQVLMWEPEDFFWIELQEMNKSLGIDIDFLAEAARELEVISGAKVQAAADLLFVTTNYIVRTGWDNLRHRQQISLQHSLLAEEIQNRKQLEKQILTQQLNLDYSLERERELVSKVKLGDFDAARKILQGLLVDIVTLGVGKTPVIKARVLELMVVLSRAAVERGADLEKTLQMNDKFVQLISRSGNIDEINLGVVHALEWFMKHTQRDHKAKNLSAVNKIKRFIRENSCRCLTLEEIAHSVYLSPYYVSRIFKEEQGITVMDYVTKVRLEEAKKLLRNHNYNIDEISEKLGYSDPSYFSRVFKRYEGVSPKQFRQQV